MTRVLLEIVTMAGGDYVLWDKNGIRFPHGELGDGEAPGAAARRLVKEWTGTDAPKLEIVDILSKPGEMTIVLRAMLVDEPQGSPTRAKRMELPAEVGGLSGKFVEEALKTSLSYKLTRG